MTNELMSFDVAKRALAKASTIDEVKDIRDKAMAMRIYARQAKDHTLEENARKIRLRAERKLGHFMRQEEKNKGGEHMKLAKRSTESTGFPKNPVDVAIPKTLASHGIDKNLANRARKLADLTEEQFEAEIEKPKITDKSKVENRVIDESVWRAVGFLVPYIDDLINSMHSCPEKYSQGALKLRKACETYISSLDSHLANQSKSRGGNVTWLSSSPGSGKV